LQKSNNKMLAALAQGVVPLVSNTPAYAETAQIIGIPELVIDSPQDVGARIDAGQISWLRQRIRSPECQQVLRQWLPATVARGYLERVQALRRQSPAPDSVRSPGAEPAVTVSAPPAPLRLSVGLGADALQIEGYRHVELLAPGPVSPTLSSRGLQGLQAYGDGIADEVMAIHVVERLHRWEVVDALKEWVRVLKPGGRLIVESPNLLTACESLLANPTQGAQPGENGSATLWCLYGDPGQRDPQSTHRWLYTPFSLAEVMHEAGLQQLAQQLPEFKAGHPRNMRVVGVKPAAQTS
jgi:hypothetical protein